MFKELLLKESQRAVADAVQQARLAGMRTISDEELKLVGAKVNSLKSGKVRAVMLTVLTDADGGCDLDSVMVGEGGVLAALHDNQGLQLALKLSEGEANDALERGNAIHAAAEAAAAADAPIGEAEDPICPGCGKRHPMIEDIVNFGGRLGDFDGLNFGGSPAGHSGMSSMLLAAILSSRRPSGRGIF